MAAPSPPAALKAIQPYLLVSNQFTKRDPIVAYYATMYAVQEGIALAKNDQESKQYVLMLMDRIEQMKAMLKGEEALSSDIVAQAHVGEVALKLFEHADQQDRRSNFEKGTIRAFLTSSHIFTITKQFGELEEDLEGKMKYAKWKAVEITKCLKNGITPTPGPPGGMGDEEGAMGFGPGPGGPSSFPPSQPGDASTSYYDTGDKPVPKPRHNLRSDYPEPGSDAFSVPPPQEPPSYGFQYGPPESVGEGGGATGGGGGRGVASGGGATGGGMASGGGATGGGAVAVGPEETAKVQKLCKFASSALDYEDVAGAVDYLQQALALLKAK